VSRGWIVLGAIAVCALYAALAPPETLAADRRWTGLSPDTNVWGDFRNWQGGALPVAGDNLIFPAGAAQPTNQNSFDTGTPFGSITIEGSGYALLGNAIQLSGGVSATQASGGILYQLHTTLTAPQTWTTSNAAGSLLINNPILLNGHTLTFDGAGTTAVVVPISNTAGTAGLTKSGLGTLQLFVPNTYNGETLISAGTLRITHPSALGTTTAGTTVQSGATLHLEGSGITVAEPLTLHGAGAGGVGALQMTGTANNRWSGPVTLATADAAVGVESSHRQVLQGAIGGPGGLTKVGSGILTLQGTTTNTYQGPTTVKTGRLAPLNAPGTLAIPGNVTVGDATGPADSARLELFGAANQIGGTATVIVTAAGTLDVSDSIQTIGALQGAGAVLLNSTGDPTGLGVGTSGASTTYSGRISGAGQLTKTGAGTLTLSGNNTYTGTTTVQQGILRITHANALGAAAAGTTVQTGATLQVESGINVAEPLTLNGTGVGGVGALHRTDSCTACTGVTWSGPVTLATDATIGLAGSLAVSIGIAGAVDGPGGLTKVGGGSLSLRGTTANTYQGTTTVNDGTLLLEKLAGTIAIPGNLNVGDGVGASDDRVSALQADQIADHAVVTLASTADLIFSGTTETIGSLAGTGVVSVIPPSGSGGGLVVGANNTSTTFTGLLTDIQSRPGGLTKVGTGTLTLTGSNSYSGPTTVQAGVLVVNGSSGSSPVTVAGGTLAGTGRMRRLTATSGAVSPGASPGVLRVDSSLALQAGASFVVQLNGTTPGSSHDQLNVIDITGGPGPVSLGGATLNATLGFTPAVGDRFVIIANDGTDPVQGTFAGLPEGSALAIGGQGFQITYKGGDGNDVVLTRVAPCIVRPNVRLPVQPASGGRLQVTVHAGADPATTGLLQSLQFTRLTNAVIEIDGQVGVTGTFTLPTPASSLTFFVRRGAQGTTQASTAELTVTDTCGTWPTLVGGGPSAF
jgi:fibronectin-binding autotransporter adhesin